MSRLGSISIALSVFSITGLSLVASRASAQEAAPPTGLLKKESVSSGKTDVASEGFEGAGAEPAPEAELSTTELQLGAGALVAAGNTRSITATAAGQFRLRREAHQLSAVAGVNYGQAADPQNSNGELERTVENYQGKARYDYFLSERFALFFGLSARRDRFQGLALRLNFAPGAAYYAIDEKNQRLWGELGYSFQHDVRFDSAVNEARAAGLPVEGSQSRHYARLFVGYSNVLNEAVTVNLGFEYLAGISPFEDEITGKNNARLGWTGALNAKVSDRFSVATAVTVDYDNNPLPGVRDTDVTTSLNLVCTLL